MDKKKKVVVYGQATKYEQIVKIGEGAQGTVFLVERLPDRKKFVAKVVFQELYFEMAEMEAERLKRIKHENIVHCEESFTHDAGDFDNYVIILEHCNFGTLSSFIEKHAGDPNLLHVFLRITSQLVQGLLIIHATN